MATNNDKHKTNGSGIPRRSFGLIVRVRGVGEYFARAQIRGRRPGGAHRLLDKRVTIRHA